MLVKLHELYTSKDWLPQLAKLDIDTKTSYRISRAIRHVESELAEADRQKNKLIMKLGEKVGDRYEIREPEAVEKFNTEFLSLLEEEVNLPIDWKIKIKLSAMRDRISSISPGFFLAFGYLIEIDDDIVEPTPEQADGEKEG